MNRPERYAFDDFVLERSQQRVLRGDGTELSLTPRVFSALLLFVEHPGELLDKDTLMAALWPGLVVEDNNLSQVVSSLRRALAGATGAEPLIQTVPRRGFRFVAPVTVLDDPGAPMPAMSTAAAEETVAPMATAPPPDAVDTNTARRRWLTIAAAGVAGSAVVGAAWLARRPGAVQGGAKRVTLAVLPFKPLVMDGRDELLEVGMADSLIARLSTIGGVVVRSVGSVRRYAGPDQDPVQAARDLDVAWIVDGSLQRRGEQLHVTARLLSVADGSAAWSGSFDERVTGIFDVQDAISERIARVLAPSLAAGRGAVVRVAFDGIGGTRNGDAYQLYLAARLHAQGIRADGLGKSAALYNQAIDVDPGYALAYAGLVETYRRMLFGADVVPADAFAPATVAARRALELAPTLAEAHAGLGWIRFWYEFDWAEAERTFRHAIALNPNVVEAHFGLGLLLLSLDRPVEGLQHLTTARELDPLSLILNALESAYLFEAGRADEATTRLTRAFQIDPDFWVAHLVRAVRLAKERRDPEALASFRRAEALSNGSTQPLANLGLQLARMGALDEARQIRDRLLALQTRRYVPPTSLAAVHVGLGENAQALDALDRAFELRDTRLVYLKDDVRWTGLRGEPRFGQLLRRLRLYGMAAGEPAP